MQQAREAEAKSADKQKAIALQAKVRELVEIGQWLDATLASVIEGCGSIATKTPLEDHHAAHMLSWSGPGTKPPVLRQWLAA
jgi:hypothetical protein